MRRTCSLALSMCGACALEAPSVAPPELYALSPQITCLSAPASPITLEGSFSFGVEDALTRAPDLRLPTLELRPRSGLAVGSPPLTTTALRIPERAITLLDDSTLELRLPPTLDAPPGVYDVVVRALDGQEAALPGALALTRPPRLTGFDPPAVCQPRDIAPLALSGEGFLVVDGVLPDLVVGERAYAPRAALDCAPMDTVDGVQVCTRLDFDLPASQYRVGDIPFWVRNPAPVGCASDAPAWVELQTPPVLAAVAPDSVCRTAGGPLTLTGSGFRDGASVLVDGVAATTVVVIDETELIATFAPGLPVGVSDVTVRNPSTCEDTLPDAFIVDDVPTVQAVWPPVIQTGASFELTAFLDAVRTQIVDVWLEVDGAAHPVSWTWDPADGALIRLVTPDDLPVGVHDVVVSDGLDCVGIAAGAFEVAQPSVGLTAWPRVVSTTGSSWVRLGGSVQPDALLYLVATSSVDAVRIPAIGPDGGVQIPAGVAPGAYHVLLTNPDGTVGRLDDGLVVVTDPAPRIDDVGPVALPAATPVTMEVLGEAFRDPSVSLVCGGIPLAAVVDAWQDDRLLATVTPTTLPEPCVLVVENADGTSAQWAGLSIADPSGAAPWTAGPPLVVARQAPAAVVARTPVSRTAIVLGGDDGDPTGAKASVEIAAIADDGSLAPWRLTRLLSGPRTRAGVASVGRFVYLVGGDEGAGPTADVRRAPILTVLDAPVPTRVDVVGVSGTGLGAGTWRYRVAALFPATDPLDPNGESVGSAPVSVVVPEGVVSVGAALTWDPVPGASRYRVFRGDGLSGELELADAVGTSFVDSGLVPSSNTVAKVDGALGNWVAVAPMGTARRAPCVVVSPDPVDPDRRYLYAFGGEDAAGRLLDTVEVFDTATDLWTPSAVTLSEPRSSCAAVALSGRENPSIPADDTWLVVGGGMWSANGASVAVDGGRVHAGGELVDWREIGGLSRKRAGHGLVATGDAIAVFGGHNGNPSSDGDLGWLDPGSLPEVTRWDAFPNLAVPRAFAGVARDGAWVLVTGGTGPLVDTETRSF